MNPAEHWRAVAQAPRLGILLDLDGTLISFALRPEEVVVGPHLLGLLAGIAALPGVVLTVVSGRPRDSLERLVGAVPGLQLAAEHGGWIRGDGRWEAPVSVEGATLEPLAAELDAIARLYDAAHVERKTWAVVLHFRGVRQEHRTGLFVEANAVIDSWMCSHPEHERLEAAAALEVRCARIRKSLAVPWTRARAGSGARLLVLGDDVTDEDMFTALTPADESVLVGTTVRRKSAAGWVLPGPDEVAAFLRWMVAVRTGEPGHVAEVLPVAIVDATHAQPEPRIAHRLLAISNRLPHLRSPTAPDDERQRRVGGLVSALELVLAAREGIWLGWSGRTVEGGEPGPLEVDELSTPPLAWIDFPQEWYELYYNGFCNRSLWPLLHTFPERIRFADQEWDCYVHVNRAFAAAARTLVGPDVPIWVHDYHLLLVAGKLRRLGHRGQVGLFLHVPFPGVDLFSMLPWAETLLMEMLQFDLLAFHTRSYADNFRQCVAALSPAQVEGDVVVLGERRIRLRVLPIGIVPEGFQEPPESTAAAEIAALLQSIGASRLVLGVDRLDYTKGIPERLYAFGRLFELFPEWRGKVSLVQISVPSRADVPEYAEQRALVETAVGRINGEFGEAHWTPIRYVYRTYGRNQLAQLYRAADVGYVTPLRDGMNLVAKEYVAAQDPASPGVLLLSRFAGAAAELGAAVLTNPYHRDGMARDLDRALRLPLEERRARYQELYAAISRSTAVTWAEDFLAALEVGRSDGGAALSKVLPTTR